MQGRATLLALFPTVILALLFGERTATLLVGYYPSSEAAWWASLELRAVFRHLSNWLEALLGYSLALQMLVLGAAVVVVWQLAFARRSIWSFLANHAALLAAATSMLISSGSIQANIGQLDRESGTLLSVVLQPTLLNGSLLLLGLLSCTYCHLTFLSDARHRQSVISTRLSELRHDL